MKRNLSLLAWGLAAVLGTSPVYSIAGPSPQDRNDFRANAQAREIPNENPQVNGLISERQAVNLARQRFAGNILRISLVGEAPDQRYQIRMENEGKVFTVFVHATTGRISGGP